MLRHPAQSSLFILSREVRASYALIRPADVVADLLILRLLNGALVILRPLSQHTLLHQVDALVEIVLFLLASLAAAQRRVEFAHQSAAAATRGLLVGGGLLLLVVG